MKKQMRMYLLALLLGNALSHAADEETIVFSTAPTHSTEVTVRLYSPLVSFLTRVTGKKVVIESADNFIEYSVRMRQGDYDILFDGPHLVGWRMAVQGHIPIARLPGTIKIVVVAREDSTVKTMQDLETGRNKVCTFASPNMLTMAFLPYYPHPARQPTLLRAQGSPMATRVPSPTQRASPSSLSVINNSPMSNHQKKEEVGMQDINSETKQGMLSF